MSVYKYSRTIQIIRYRATATLLQPQIQQYIDSNETWGRTNQREHHIILTKYEEVHTMFVSEI